jgi:hypothetical protein
MADSAVKKHYDYAQQQIDEQAILDKYNAATVAQFNVQREQNRQAENQFYNEMYNTQKTAMDTIRQSNAAAVASGASRGVQAAQELSSLLGLQQESVASATELAQANRQTAQEETAAVLENVLNAYKQATDERSQLISQGIEAESLLATQASAAADAERAAAEIRQQYFDRLDKGDTEGAAQIYFEQVAPQARITEGMSDADITNASSFMQQAMNSLQTKYTFVPGDFSAMQSKDKNAGYAKIRGLAKDLTTLARNAGMAQEYTDYEAVYSELKQILEPTTRVFNNVSTQNDLLPRLLNTYTQAYVDQAKAKQNTNK